MDFAIIVRKYADGSTETLRSTRHPPTAELHAQARRLDRYLQTRMSKVEDNLVAGGLLPKGLSQEECKAANVDAWYALGSELRAICKKLGIGDQRQRRWLWEAIQNLHATARIKRAERRRGRNHFEYCYRLAGFPKAIASKLNWGEWVYFFDSLTIREEPRADEWVARKAQGPNIGRRLFRRFTQNLNRRINKLDTTVLESSELFRIYDDVWTATRKELDDMN